MVRWCLWLFILLFSAVPLDAQTPMKMTSITTSMATLMEHQTTLPVQHLRCLQSALIELDKKSINSENYQASLYLTDKGYRVLFQDKQEPLSARGSVTSPGFEVVLDSQCCVLESHFSR